MCESAEVSLEFVYVTHQLFSVAQDIIPLHELCVWFTGVCLQKLKTPVAKESLRKGRMLIGNLLITET
jgi:hypothetical protein